MNLKLTTSEYHEKVKTLVEKNQGNNPEFKEINPFFSDTLKIVQDKERIEVFLIIADTYVYFLDANTLENKYKPINSDQIEEIVASTTNK